MAKTEQQQEGDLMAEPRLQSKKQPPSWIEMLLSMLGLLAGGIWLAPWMVRVSNDRFEVSLAEVLRWTCWVGVVMSLVYWGEVVRLWWQIRQADKAEEKKRADD